MKSAAILSDTKHLSFQVSKIVVVNPRLGGELGELSHDLCAQGGGIALSHRLAQLAVQSLRQPHGLRYGVHAFAFPSPRPFGFAFVAFIMPTGGYEQVMWKFRSCELLPHEIACLAPLMKLGRPATLLEKWT